MKQQAFNRIAGVVLITLGLVHLVRIFQGWEAVISGWTVPMGFSWAVVFVAWYLGLNAAILAKRK